MTLQEKWLFGCLWHRSRTRAHNKRQNRLLRLFQCYMLFALYQSSCLNSHCKLKSTKVPADRDLRLCLDKTKVLVNRVVDMKASAVPPGRAAHGVAACCPCASSYNQLSRAMNNKPFECSIGSITLRRCCQARVQQGFFDFALAHACSSLLISKFTLTHVRSSVHLQISRDTSKVLKRS